MIFTAFLTLLIVPITIIIGYLPDLPDMPSAITTSASVVITYVGQAFGLLSLWFSTPLVVAMAVSAIALMGFEYFYHLTMWVLRKIPMINVK